MLWDLSYSRILSIDSFAKFFIRVCSFHHLYGLAVIPHDHFEIQRPSESWAAGLRQYVYLDSLDVAPPPPRSCANRSVVFSLGIRCFLRLLAAEFRCNIFQFTLSSKPSSVSAPLGVHSIIKKSMPSLACSRVADWATTSTFLCIFNSWGDGAQAGQADKRYK